MADENEGARYIWKGALALTVEDGAAIDAIAAREDRPVGQVLRRLIRDALEARASAPRSSR